MNDARARGAATGLPAPLIRLHRHSQANLLVMGGTRARRLAIARTFHHRGPHADEPFVAIDCARDEPRLARALERWLLTTGASGAEVGESKDPIGVLYLDSIADLSAATQRLLLMCAHRLQGQQADPRPPGPSRLMAGDRGNLIRAAECGRFSRALVDHLDKIRVELGWRRARGAA